MLLLSRATDANEEKAQMHRQRWEPVVLVQVPVSFHGGGKYFVCPPAGNVLLYLVETYVNEGSGLLGRRPPRNIDGKVDGFPTRQ
jgi:hypothetical protein